MTTHRPQPTKPDEDDRPARERLRQYWLHFGELAKHNAEDVDQKTGKELVDRHRLVLDEMVASGEVPELMAILVQKAYAAGVHHIWRSKSPEMCYRMAEPMIHPSTAELLVKQAKVLNEINQEGTINPETLAKVRAAVEQDLVSFVLPMEETRAQYDQLVTNFEDIGQAWPSLEEFVRQQIPGPSAAVQFIMDLLTNK